MLNVYLILFLSHIAFNNATLRMRTKYEEIMDKYTHLGDATKDKYCHNRYRCYDCFNIPYFFCLAGTNLPCRSYHEDSSHTTHYPPVGKIWTGVCNRTTDLDYKPGDVIVDKRTTQSFDDFLKDWQTVKPKDCTFDEIYYSEKCPDDAQYKKVTIPVILRGGNWLVVDRGTALLSDGEQGMLHLHKDMSGADFDEVEPIVFATYQLFWMTKGKKLQIDGYGFREVLVGYKSHPQMKGECSLSRRKGVWRIHLDPTVADPVTVSVTINDQEKTSEVSDSNGIEVPVQWQTEPGKIHVEAFVHGYHYASCSTHFDSLDVCLYSGVISRLKNYNCWTPIEWFAFTGVALLILLTFATFTTLIVGLCKCLKTVGFWSWRLTRCLGCTAIKSGKRVVNQVKTAVVLTEIAPPAPEEEPLIVRVDQPVTRRGNRQPNAKTIVLGVLSFLSLMLGGGLGEASCENTVLGSFKETCSGINCNVDGAVDIIFSPGQHVACFKPKKRSMSEVLFKIQIKNYHLRCVKEVLYWTADFEPQTCSIFKCPTDCANARGAAMELNCGRPEDPVIKAIAPGCAGVGCWSCDAACVFYKPYYKIESSSIPVQVFRCTSWVPVLQLALIKVDKGVVETTDFDLSLNMEVSSDNGKYTLLWTQANTIPTPVISTTFLQDGSRVCMSNVAPKGETITSLPGMVQCPSKESVSSLRGCEYSTSLFACTVGGTNEVSCLMKRSRWTDLCNDSWIPKRFGDNELSIKAGYPALIQPSFGSVQLRASLNGLEVEGVMTTADCKIEDGTVKGCYSCVDGAKLITSTVPDGEAALIHVQCDTSIQPFTFRCGMKEVKVISNDPDVNTKCIARWGLKTAEFQVSGTLTSGVKVITSLTQAGDNVAISHQGSDLIFPSLKGFLLSHYVTGPVLIVSLFVLLWLFIRFFLFRKAKPKDGYLKMA